MGACGCLDSSHILKIRIDASSDTQYGSLTIPADLVHDAADNRVTNDVMLDFSMREKVAITSAIDFNPLFSMTPVNEETKTLPLVFHVICLEDADIGSAYTYSTSCYEMNSTDGSVV